MRDIECFKAKEDEGLDQTQDSGRTILQVARGENAMFGLLITQMAVTDDALYNFAAQSYEVEMFL